MQSKPNLTFKILDKTPKDDVSIQNTIFYKNENFDLTSEFSSRPNTQNLFYRDEGYDSFGAEIWPIVSKQPKATHFLWEYYDNPNVNLEKPFLCETNLKTIPLLQTVVKNKCFATNCNSFNPPLVIENQKFVKYVKYMLVGMASVIFLVDDYDLFYLKDDICVEDLSQEALKSYCVDLEFCGSCFRSLNKLCDIYTSNTIKNCGYVFKVRVSKQ